MEIRDAIKAMIKKRGITQAELGEKMGCKQTNVAMYIKSNMAIKVESLLKIANVCGYDIVLVDREDRGNVYSIGVDRKVGEADEDSLNVLVRRIVQEELSKKEG